MLATPGPSPTVLVKAQLGSAVWVFVYQTHCLCYLYRWLRLPSQRPRHLRSPVVRLSLILSAKLAMVRIAVLARNKGGLTIRVGNLCSVVSVANPPQPLGILRIIVFVIKLDPHRLSSAL